MLSGRTAQSIQACPFDPPAAREIFMRRSSMNRAAAALCGEPADQLHFSESSICGLMQINDD
jgi:hypothetical protein